MAYKMNGKPDREGRTHVKQDNEERCTKEPSIDNRRHHASVFNDARRHSSRLLLLNLNCHENGSQDPEDRQKSDYSAIALRILASTPL
jgi:hypothetical protein